MLGSILLFVLGLPLVVYNAPACFFGTSFEDEYFKEREDRLIAHNESSKAWNAEGRRRCLDHLFSDSSGAKALFVRVRVAEPWKALATPSSFPIVGMHALVPIGSGDLIPDVFNDLTEGRLVWPEPLRIVNTDAFDLSALEVSHPVPSPSPIAGLF